MGSSAVGELMLLVLLPVAIKASDVLERRHAQAVRARRRAVREAKHVAPAAPSRSRPL